MGWEEGTGFRVVGCVSRVFIADSGKFAKVSVDVRQSPHAAKVEFKIFDRSVIGEIWQLRIQKGTLVQVRGKIESEKLTDKSRAPIKVDGYEVWMPALRPSSIEIEGEVRASEPVQPEKKIEREPDLGDASDPFADSGDFDDGNLF